MRFKQAGNKADTIISPVRNAEASATIPRGSPLVLKYTDNAIDSVKDGVDVVLPGTAGNALSAAMRFGVALNTMVAGDFGEATQFGIVPYAIITRATRAGTSTSDSWSSSASIASGIGLGFDTLNNAFVMGASAAGSVVSAPNAVLMDSISSITASATATSDTRTALTVAARVFVRML